MGEMQEMREESTADDPPVASKVKPIRSKKILNAARGELCTLNAPGCDYGTETTVFCHLNESYAGKGLGIKAFDVFGFFGCAKCHTCYDTGKLEDKHEYLLRAVTRTWRRLIERGIVNVS